MACIIAFAKAERLAAKQEEQDLKEFVRSQVAEFEAKMAVKQSCAPLLKPIRPPKPPDEPDELLCMNRKAGKAQKFNSGAAKRDLAETDREVVKADLKR